MRPGLTTATQYSGAPLPLPMRVSAGFLVTGLSGNIRIQILPPRLMWRVIAIRAASICRSVIQAGSRHLSPYSPKLISLPRVATPDMRPRICFRCLTFFGINMMFYPIGDCRLPILRTTFVRPLLQIGNRQLKIGNARRFLRGAFYRLIRLRLHARDGYVDVARALPYVFR